MTAGWLPGTGKGRRLPEIKGQAALPCRVGSAPAHAAAFSALFSSQLHQEGLGRVKESCDPSGLAVEMGTAQAGEIVQGN